MFSGGGLYFDHQCSVQWVTAGHSFMTQSGETGVIRFLGCQLISLSSLAKLHGSGAPQFCVALL